MKCIHIIEPAGELFESPLGSSMEIAKPEWRRSLEGKLAIDHERFEAIKQSFLSKPARTSVLQNEGLPATYREFKQCLHEAAGRPIGRVEASYQSFRPCLNDERN